VFLLVAILWFNECIYGFCVILSFSFHCQSKWVLFPQTPWTSWSEIETLCVFFEVRTMFKHLLFRDIPQTNDLRLQTLNSLSRSRIVNLGFTWPLHNNWNRFRLRKPRKFLRSSSLKWGILYNLILAKIWLPSHLLYKVVLIKIPKL
jgi:hypothetical protein